MEIDAPLLPDAHELNHAYTYLRVAAPAHPLSRRRDGRGDRVRIRGAALGARSQTPTGAGGRRASRSDRVYGLGGLFVRHMIRRHGIEEFLRYYEQSPERRDPALFAANFESFWGERIDDVWTDFTTITAGVPWVDQKICPCSLPPITPGDGDRERSGARALLDVARRLATPRSHSRRRRYQSVSVRSCAGDTFAARRQGRPGAPRPRPPGGTSCRRSRTSRPARSSRTTAPTPRTTRSRPTSLVGNPYVSRHHSGDRGVDRLPRDRCPVSARREGLGRVRDVRQLRLRPG